MKLTKAESVCIIDVLETLIYNHVKDLKTKLIKAKATLESEKYKIMLFGDQDLYSGDLLVKDRAKYKSISSLDGRWCLQSQLFYHLTKTKKITQAEYNELVNF